MCRGNDLVITSRYCGMLPRTNWGVERTVKWAWCQNGSDHRTSGARPRRIAAARFPVSAKEKPQMTKRYRTM